MKIPFFDPHEEIYIEYLKNYKKHNVPVQQYHDGYELYLLIDGERSLFYNDMCHTLKRGDLAVIRPFELHYAESGDAEFYERYVLNFKPSQLEPILSENESKLLFNSFNSRLLHLNEEQLQTVYSSFILIDSLTDIKNPLSRKSVCAAILSLLVFISGIHQTDIPSAAKGLPQEIISAINYINTRYADNISLDMVAGALHMSKYHFCRVFKEVTGTTFLEYLHNVRLSHAHRLLIQSDLPVSEIAVRTGFGSAAYFSRMFKKTHGISPRAARI